MAAEVHKCLEFAFAEKEAKAVFHRLLRTHRVELVEDGYEPASGLGRTARAA